jgi:hypothetical protein
VSELQKKNCKPERKIWEKETIVYSHLPIPEKNIEGNLISV